MATNNSKTQNFFHNMVLGIIIGAIGFGINILAYFVLARLFKLNYLQSNAFAWLAYIIFLYIARTYYFYQDLNLGVIGRIKRLGRFIAVRLSSGILDMIMMFILVSLVGVHSMNAKFITLAVVMVANFVLGRFWIFKPDNTKLKEEESNLIL